jgi:hypothetical protein
MAMRPELVQMALIDSEQFPAGVSGKDPRIYASAAMGEKIIELQLERMAKILTDILKI